jgi:hypothetical protein
MRGTVKRAAVVLAVAAAALAAATAAFAVDDDTPYDAKASSQSSFEIPGVLSIGGHSESESANAGAGSQATGSSFSVAGNEIASGPSCSASAKMGDHGDVEDQKSGSVQTIGDETTPATISLFSSSCYAHAQSNNNSNASSSGAVATVSAPGAAEIVVGRSASTTDTTSGESSATSSFTGVSVTAGDASLTVIDCRSSASADNDSSSSFESSSLVNSGDQTIGFPDGTECPAGTSSATYSRG